MRKIIIRIILVSTLYFAHSTLYSQEFQKEFSSDSIYAEIVENIHPLGNNLYFFTRKLEDSHNDHPGAIWMHTDSTQKIHSTRGQLGGVNKIVDSLYLTYYGFAWEPIVSKLHADSVRYYATANSGIPSRLSNHIDFNSAMYISAFSNSDLNNYVYEYKNNTFSITDFSKDINRETMCDCADSYTYFKHKGVLYIGRVNALIDGFPEYVTLSWDGIGEPKYLHNFLYGGKLLEFQNKLYSIYNHKLWRIEQNDTTKISPDFLEISERFITFNGSLLFVATDSDHGTELWKYNGNSAPQMVADIAGGSESSSPADFSIYNGTLYFTAYSTEYGKEIWSYNGAGAPERLSELCDGSCSHYPKNLTAHNGKMYFIRDTSEVWSLSTEAPQATPTSACNVFNSPSGTPVYKSGLFYDTLEQRYYDITIHNTVRYQNKYACEYFVGLSGDTLTESGIYSDTILNENMCDSIIITNLTIEHNSEILAQLPAEPDIDHSLEKYDGVSYDYYLRMEMQKSYIRRTDYRFDTVQTFGGCEVRYISYGTSTNFGKFDGCESLTLPNGQEIFESGIYADSLFKQIHQSFAYPDSVILYLVEIHQPHTETNHVMACDSFTSPSGNKYTASASISDTLLTQFGCDSIITTELTIENSSYESIEVEQPEYISPSGKVFSGNGVYLDTIVGDNGCNIYYTITIVAPTGIGSVFSLSVLPNPAKDYIAVNFSEDFSGKLEIVDMNGVVQLKKQIKSAISYQVAIGSLSAGTYILRLSNDESLGETIIVRE